MSKQSSGGTSQRRLCTIMTPIKVHPLKILVPPKTVKFYVDSHCATPEARGCPKNKKNKKNEKCKKLKNVKIFEVFQGSGGGIAGGWPGGGWGVMGGASGVAWGTDF